MAETENILQLQTRETGKTAVKATRNAGLIPGVFYIKTGESIPFAVKPLEVRDVVYTSETKIINIKIEGEEDVRECILKQVDFDPVTDQILHLDFYGIIRGQKLTVDIPVICKGSPVGVKEGGVLQQSIRTVSVSCLPKNLPSSIEVDVTELSLGSTIYFKDVLIEDVEFLIPEDTAIVSVVTPRVSVDDELEAEAAEGEEAAAEGEEAAAEGGEEKADEKSE